MAGIPPAELQYLLAHAGDDKRPEVIIPLIVGGIFAYAAVGLRLYARRKGAVALGWDDGFIVFALFAYTLYIIALGLTSKYGLGRHIILVTNPMAFASSAIAAQAIYEVTIFSIKFSILFLYRRIFPQKWFRNVLIGLGIFIACNNTAQFLVNVFQCVPFAKNYDKTIDGVCINQGAHILAEGVINIITDWVMLALPLPLLWKLQVTARQKWQLCFTFLSGGIVCVVSIVRLFYVIQVGSIDASWQDTNGAAISGIEQSLGIIVACIPTFRLLIAKTRFGSQAARRSAYDSAGWKGGSNQLSDKRPGASVTGLSSNGRWQTLTDGTDNIDESIVLTEVRGGTDKV